MDTRFEEYTIAHFHADLMSKTVTSVELTQWYLDRIDALDAHGPALSSIVTVNPAALDEAQRADDYFAKHGRLVGPLHGVPVVVKDQAETAGLRTTFGSQLFADFVPNADSAVVEKLRTAGAVIHAKAAMNDLACGYSSHSTITGTTKNPYDVERDTGGSSAGTGAAIAANLGLVGIGEDTGGSIRVPAAHNNLFGLRVTTGRISRRGLQGLVPLQDTPGPMTRTVADLAVVTDALIGYDPADPMTSIEHDAPAGVSFAEAATEPPEFSAWRVGVLETAFSQSDDPEEEPVTRQVRSAIQRLSGAGAHIVPGLEIDDLAGWFERTSLYGSVSRSVLTAFFASHGAPVDSYEEFLSDRHHNPVLSTFADIAGGTDDPERDPVFLAAVYQQKLFRQVVLDLMAKHDLDFLVFPTVRILPPLLAGMAAGVDVAAYPTNTIVGSQAVLPAMSLPTGLTDAGLPVGMEVVARPLNERRLVQFAARWEAETSPRIKPVLTGI